MRQTLRISASCLIVAIMCVAVVTTDADAQTYMTSRPGGRAGIWDFFMPLSYNPSWTFNGQGGSRADMDATFGFGFGFGYNLSDHFQLNGLFSWSARNYSATLADSNGQKPITIQQHRIQLHIFAGRGLLLVARGHQPLRVGRDWPNVY